MLAAGRTQCDIDLHHQLTHYSRRHRPQEANHWQRKEKAHAILPTTPAASTAEPFRPLIRELQRLDDKNPVLAEQAARLVALYRRLWESYVTKHADSSRLERENHQLQLAHSRLTDEKSRLEHHCREQEALSSHFQEAFRKVREGVIEVFEKWEDPKAELAKRTTLKETRRQEATLWLPLCPRCTPQTARVLVFLNRLNSDCTVVMGMRINGTSWRSARLMRMVGDCT
jgi:hypothetical protein